MPIEETTTLTAQDVEGFKRVCALLWYTSGHTHVDVEDVAEDARVILSAPDTSVSSKRCTLAELLGKSFTLEHLTTEEATGERDNG